MKIPPRHLCDEELLLLDEDELHSSASQRAESHLQACAACRRRRQVLRQEDKQLRAAAVQVPLPSPDAARVRLLASLDVAARDAANVSRWSLWAAALLQPSMLLRAGALAALLVMAAAYRQAGRPLQDLMATYEETGPKPDHNLTPGSASALTVAEVCRLNDDDLDPRLPLEKQRAVFLAYRMNERVAKGYQVDYLINPQLGGDDSLQNLWPEPYHATVWNATAKDALEARLHGMVCNQEIDLQLAQHELATDWIAAYKKYFHTSRPVNTVAIVGQPSFR